MGTVWRLLLVVIFFVVSHAGAVELLECTVNTSVPITSEIDEDKAYEIAKVKLCRKALVDSMRGENNQVVRRNWKMLGVESVVFERPHKYFKEIILLNCIS